MTKTELLQRWFDEVWFRGNLDAIDELFAPSTKANGLLPEMAMGPEDFRELVTVLREHIGDIKVTLVKTIENGDWLAALLQARMNRTDNGAPVEVTGQVIVRFDGDKMTEAYNQFDMISWFEQLGQMPPNTLPVCLTGQMMGWA